MSGAKRSWAAALIHPLPVAAAAVLAVNDHLLKGSGWMAGWLTGKLSDLAGLFVFPLLAAAVCRCLLVALGQRSVAERRAIDISCIVATGLGFTAIKLSPWFNQWVSSFIGRNSLDPTDLIALPVLALAAVWSYRFPVATGSAGFGRAAAVSVIALACAATSAPRYPRNFPTWEIQGDVAVESSCAEAMAWVVKSGKSGIGITVATRALSTAGCTVSIPRAELNLAGRPITATAGPASIELASCEVGHFYLPFAFDNEAAWNRGVRSGDFYIELVMDGDRHSWQLRGEQRLRSYHVKRHYGGDDERVVEWPRSCGGARLEQGSQ